MYLERREIPPKSYFFLLAFNLAAGCFNAGFVLAGNTNVGGVLAVQLAWDKKDFYNTEMSAFAVLGLMIGSILSKLVIGIGRRRSILYANVLITATTIPYFFTSNFGWLCTSRLILGFCSALIINASSAYIGETVPKEYQNGVGTSINTGIVTGIFITNLFGLLLPDPNKDEAAA